MDFSGRGFITYEDLKSSLVVRNLIDARQFTLEDLEAAAQHYSLFPTQQKGMTFDTFKRIFFAHLHHSFNLRDLSHSKVEENPVVRRKDLEAFLKEKFTKTWISVKKAFLDLDSDHDGFITAEDFVRYFRTEADFPFQDMQHLL